MMEHFATRVSPALNSTTAAARILASDSYDLQTEMMPLIDELEQATFEAQDLMLDAVRVGGLGNLDQVNPLERYQRVFLTLENRLARVQQSNPRQAQQAQAVLDKMEELYEAMDKKTLVSDVIMPGLGAST